MLDLHGKNGIGSVRNVDIRKLLKVKENPQVGSITTPIKLSDDPELTRIEEDIRELYKAHIKNFVSRFMNPSSREFMYVSWEDVEKDIEKKKRREAYKEFGGPL